MQQETAGIAGLTLSATGAGPDCGFLDQPNAVPVRAGESEPGEFQTWVPKLLQRLDESPEPDNVAIDLQQQGLTVNLVIDRRDSGALRDNTGDGGQRAV